MDEVVTVDVAMGRLERLEGFGLAVHPERCARVRHRHASCARCAAACTSGALAFRDGALVVNEALCVGCGTCATVCPTCAIEARHPADAQLLAAARATARTQALGGGSSCAGGLAAFTESRSPEGGLSRADDASARACANAGGETFAPERDYAGATVTFACHRAFAEAPTACAQAGAIELACLSRMEESLAMRLFADGAQRVRLLHGACTGCPRENGFSSVALVCETMEKLIAAWGLNCAYEVEQVAAEMQRVAAETNDAEDDCALEAICHNGSKSGTGVPPAQDVASDAVGRVGAAAPRLARVQADGTLPHFVPLRRHALLDALADLGGKPAVIALDTRLWGHIAIDMGKCKSCKMCAVFCPTGALQKYVGENGHGGVEHYPAECVHCGLCQDICPAGAIVSSTCVPADALVDGKTECYPMPDPAWKTGPDQILRKMTPQIHSIEVQHSY